MAHLGVQDAFRIREEGMKAMKRLISATLALSLLGVTAASAAPYGYDRQGYGYDSQYRDSGYRSDNNGAAIAAGVGFLALAAILASQNHRDFYADRGYRGGWHDNRGYGGHDFDRGHDRRGWR
jgi:hypothetical protein